MLMSMLMSKLTSNKLLSSLLLFAIAAAPAVAEGNDAKPVKETAASTTSAEPACGRGESEPDSCRCQR